jgi:hypothetical protein
MILSGQGLYVKDGGTFDWDDELREDGKEFVGAFFDKLIGSLARQEPVRLLSLTKSLKENRQMQVVVQVFRLHLPCKLNDLGGTFLSAPWKLTATGRSPLS